MRSTFTQFATLCFAAGLASYGQNLFGTLTGTVLDQSGSAVPKASVVVTNTGTSQRWELAANEIGSFTLASIPPGSYAVKVSATGFRSFNQDRVVVQANATVRVEFHLEVGAVSESVEVNAAAVALQTDTMDVRNEIRATDLQNTPVPVSRNYQNLLVTVPGMAPPTNAHSISANPSRALVLNSNGSNAQSTAVRVDGATTWNAWLPHLSGYVPTLEAIDQVSVQANSYEADTGFAGGASVNVQIKSGTNQFHGSGFWYHSNQHLKARPYFLPASQGQPKRIMNQYGGSLGGPVIKDRVFFFAAYEGTPDRSSAFQLVAVPTAAMKAGDYSASPMSVYDPLTGEASGANRTQFPDNRVPASRISPITAKIMALTPNPNIGPAGAIVQNFFNSGSFLYDRHTLDTKMNARVTDKLNVAGRVSYLDWRFDNPALFGQLGGTGLDGRGSYDGLGLGATLSMTYSAVYTLSPTIVIDGYAGYTLLDNGVENIRLDENLGRDFLGIPGTNGSNRNEGGWPGFNVAGFAAYGRAQNNSPWNLNLPQAQYVAGASVLKRKHNIRFGWDSLYVGQNGNEPFGSPGFFTFAQGVTGTQFPNPANPAQLTATPTNPYNSYASFALGLPSNLQRTVRRETGVTRTWAQSLYIRDKWQPTQKLTVSIGLRWDYFGTPTRGDGRGLETFDLNTGVLTLCGLGSVTVDSCGFHASKKNFSPRLGIAYRTSQNMVIRAGYGIAWDPVNIGRNPLQTYPILSSASFPSANAFQFVSPIAQGIPNVAPPSVGDGRIQVPSNVALELIDPKFRRSYIQSWNFMIERETKGWLGQIGYVGNRSLRLQNRWNANYGFIGGGTASQVLRQRFGYLAGANIFSDAGGFRGYYDSLQTSVQRRMDSGHSVRLSYTWSKAQGPWSGNDFGVDGYNISNPEYWPIAAKGVKSYDRTHNFNAAFTWQLPFGAGQKFANSGAPAAVLGGWQVNGLYTAYTGGPFTVTSPGASLNAPGNSQIADQIKPSVDVYNNPNRWFDTSAYAQVTAARFGNSGWNQLRGPGMNNVDLSIYRAFKLTERLNAQFRAEMFNISNTPHFSNPNGDVSNAANFGRITGIANTGREGIDERMVRFGLRLSF
ncbi:MAG: hypothetical protein FJW38_23940 [Acidobacteria bacterium]|nr:hypothetical protein [Acidobacteriota bacterium]